MKHGNKDILEGGSKRDRKERGMVFLRPETAWALKRKRVNGVRPRECECAAVSHS